MLIDAATLTTANNTLEDGSGNVTIAGKLTVGGLVDPVPTDVTLQRILMV